MFAIEAAPRVVPVCSAHAFEALRTLERALPNSLLYLDDLDSEPGVCVVCAAPTDSGIASLHEWPVRGPISEDV